MADDRVQETSAVALAAREDGAARAALTALVVDDSRIDRQVAGRILQQKLQATVQYFAEGGEAIAAIRRQPPDVVLTDLKMPGMDGLTLVETLRRQFPLLPTILMTAHGSEATAVAALRCGAASYVPKQFLAGMLVETVERVLRVSRAQRDECRLQDCWVRSEFHFRLDNDLRLIAPLVAQLQRCAQQAAPRDENEVLRMGMALQEALANAVCHGNLELDPELRRADPPAYYRQAEARRMQPPYAARRVTVTAVEAPGETRYVIRDEGPGFNVAAVTADAENPEHLHRSSGRGLFLMRTFLDEVSYNARGNEVTLVQRRRGEHPPAGGPDGAASPAATEL